MQPLAAGICIGIGFALGWLLAQKKPKKQYHFIWSVTDKPVSIKEGVSLMADIPAGTSKTFGVKIVDQFGNPAEVQDPKWECAPADILTITVSDPPQETPTKGKQKARDANNPYFATVQSGGTTGGGSLTFTADADLGEGVKELVGTVAINVLAGEAVSVEIVELPSPPEKKK